MKYVFTFMFIINFSIVLLSSCMEVTSVPLRLLNVGINMIAVITISHLLLKKTEK